MALREDGSSDRAVHTRDESPALSHVQSADGQQEQSPTGNHELCQKQRKKRRLPSPDKDLKVRSKKIRLRGAYRPKYRALLNSIIADASRGQVAECSISLDLSIVGAVRWTSEEKRHLFDMLQVIGSNEYGALSRAIGTKTESETREFLHLLEQASAEDHLRSTDYYGISHDEIPAAFELSPACEAELDLAAERLAWKAEMSDIKREKSKYGIYWLLDNQTAAQIDPSQPVTSENDGGLKSLPNTLTPAVELLQLRNWIELERLFMSSSADFEESWTDFIEDGEQQPAMFCTAFVDFFNLAVSLTKRLVHASHFQALSRLRATSRNDPERSVRHQDVQAATRVLGLNQDWTEFWATCPRRNNLQVYTRGAESSQGDKNGVGEVLTYEKVERILKSGGDESDGVIDDVQAGSPLESDPLEDDITSSSRDSWAWTDTTTSLEGDVRLDDDVTEENLDRSISSNKPADHSDDSGPRVSAKNRHHRETQYLEGLDRRASLSEEARLWDILKHQAPQDMIKEEDDATSFSPPPRQRSTIADVENWRAKVSYRASWEELDTLPSAQDFADTATRGDKARKRRRRVHGISDADG